MRINIRGAPNGAIIGLYKMETTFLHTSCSDGSTRSIGGHGSTTTISGASRDPKVAG